MIVSFKYNFLLLFPRVHASRHDATRVRHTKRRTFTKNHHSDIMPFRLSDLRNLLCLSDIPDGHSIPSCRNQILPGCFGSGFGFDHLAK